MSSFIIAANAVVPFMIYILFGMIIRKAGLADGPFLTKLNKLLFKAFFPLLMFRNITGIESGMNFSPGMVVFAVAGLLLLIGLLILAIPRIESEDARRGVMIQAIFRGNYALFSIPLTTSLFGAEGTALSSLMMLVSIPMYNVMAVVVLSLFGGGKVSLWKILKDIAANPLIDGILAGLLFRLLGIRLPAAVSSPIAALAACTTPMALCVLGARMQLTSVRGNRKSILLVLALKLAIVPALVTVCATALACTWDTELIAQVGEAAALEAKENNIGVWLAPAINIHRSPLCGRNFEYWSEDPLVAGRCAGALVHGVQSQKIGTSLKHFCCNNKETNRKNSDSRVSERALREIYLKGFELIVKHEQPYTIMTSYNKMNGIHTSENQELLTGILRGEWGYQGMVTTDWWTNGEHYLEAKAGNDLKMGAGFPERVREAYDRGLISKDEIRADARRILATILKFE